MYPNKLADLISVHVGYRVLASRELVAMFGQHQHAFTKR